MRILVLDQPGVAITDFILSAESLLLMFLLLRHPHPRHSAIPWFAAMFGFLGVASLAGGILHGYFNSPAAPMHKYFWDTTLLSIGAVSLSCFNLATALLPALTPARKLVLRATVIAFLPYALYVLTGYRTFLTAIIVYLPATLLLLAAIVRRHMKAKSKQTWCGLVGIVLTFVAAGVQQSHFFVEPYLLNYNTLYHIIQGIALVLLYMFGTGTDASE